MTKEVHSMLGNVRHKCAVCGLSHEGRYPAEICEQSHKVGGEQLFASLDSAKGLADMFPAVEQQPCERIILDASMAEVGKNKAEDSSAWKADGGKDPWHLLPYDALSGVVKVLAFGANKYAERNWEKGMAWSRCFAALQRHLTAWWSREQADPETGMSHLWHAGCCVLFLIAFEIRGRGDDDRPSLDA